MESSFLILALLVLVGCTSPTSPNGRIIITEVMTNNQDTVFDQFSEPSDWIEISNIYHTPISLENSWISDNLKNSTRWDIPNTILYPEESLTIFASGRNLIDTDDALHRTRSDV